jgi:hypothetical protein
MVMKIKAWQECHKIVLKEIGMYRIKTKFNTPWNTKYSKINYHSCIKTNLYEYTLFDI